MATNDLAFQLEMRAFIPFPKLAGNFHGDDRGFSVSGDRTSRISATVDLNPLTGTFNNKQVHSDPTYGPLEFVGPMGGDYCKAEATIESVQTDRGAQYDFRISGSNPIARPSPDIDHRIQISINQTVPNTFHIHATLSGDQFPAVEAVLRDRSGQGLFLGGFMPSAQSDIWKLAGNAGRVEGSLDMNVVTDDGGKIARITNVELTTLNGKIGNALDFSTSYTVAGWNRAAMQILTPEGMHSPEAVKQESAKSHAAGKELSTPKRAGMDR